jgi:hypothetical protein
MFRKFARGKWGCILGDDFLGPRRSREDSSTRFYESLDLCTGLFRWDHRHLACAKVVQDSDSCKYDFGFSAHILARSILGANRKSIECANSLHPGFDVSKIDCLSQELDFVRLLRFINIGIPRPRPSIRAVAPAIAPLFQFIF